MYKIKLKRALTCAVALAITVPTLIGFSFAAPGQECETCGVAQYGNSGIETMPLGLESLVDFDPNRPWTQDEDGTIWQDGIPFANMDDVFVFDSIEPLQRSMPDWQDRRITSSDPGLINMADHLILAYLRNNSMTLEEALAISHAELPFIILNGEAIRTDARGVAYTEISEESMVLQSG